MLRYTYDMCLAYIKPGGIENNHSVCKGYQLLANLRSEINGDTKTL